jgi:DNA-binding PadR family transcriptional regulator
MYLTKGNVMHHHGDRGFGPGWQFGRRGFGGGFRPFGGGFKGGRGPGGGAFRAGRMLADGDLRLIALALLAEAPRHGYDLIKALEELSSGFYSPSPGVVYPTLTYLEEVGYATASVEGTKKVYSITAEGRAHLEENRELVDSVMKGIARIGQKMARVRAWWEGDEDGRGGDRPDRDIPGVVPEVNEARRALKAAIASKIDAPDDEQRRVASVLREAAAAIRGGETPAPDPVDLG